VAVSGRTNPPELPPWRDLFKHYGSGGFVPIRAGRSVLGVLGVAYREMGPPPQSQMRFLETLGRQLGAALQVVRSREARTKAHAETLTIRKITAALSTNLEPRGVIDMVTAAAAQLTRASGAIVLLRSADGTEFEVASQSDVRGRVHLVALRFPAQGSLAARVLRTGRSFRCRDATLDRRPMLRQLVALANVRGLLIVPLRTSEGVIGTLNVSSQRPRLFSDRDRRVLIRIGQQASIAIQNARLFDAVRSNRQLLRQLYSQQFATLEAERKRIAHELHDEMGPTLSATLINLQIARRLATDPALSAKVAETERLLRGMVEKVRELSYGLRPPMLEHLGLAESLRWMIDSHFSAGKLAVTYRVSGSDADVDSGLALAIYRIAQEALTNVVRHADASRATVRLTISDDLTLEIEDNGRGFDPQNEARGHWTGLGLAGMRERMEQLLGWFEIRSAPGQGCRLTVSCPLEVQRAGIAG
jgi:signal transduction histidine kinase